MEFLKTDKPNQRQQSPHESSQRSNDNNDLSANSSAQLSQPDSPLMNPNKLVAAGQMTLTANMLRPYGLSNFLNTQTPTLNNNIYQFNNNEFNTGLHHQQQQQQLHQLQQQQSGHNQLQSLHNQTISNHHHLHNHQNLIHQQQSYQHQQQQQYQLQLQQQQPQLMNYANRSEKSNDDDEENELINQANNLRNAGCK
jgi:hypothetical protein